MEKVADDDTRAWTPSIRVGDPDEVPNSWLWPETVLTIVAKYGVKQQVEIIVCVTLSQ